MDTFQHYTTGLSTSESLLAYAPFVAALGAAACEGRPFGIVTVLSGGLSAGAATAFGLVVVRRAKDLEASGDTAALSTLRGLRQAGLICTASGVASYLVVSAATGSPATVIHSVPLQGTVYGVTLLLAGASALNSVLARKELSQSADTADGDTRPEHEDEADKAGDKGLLGSHREDHVLDC
jgi:hypothetical protein